MFFTEDYQYLQHELPFLWLLLGYELGALLALISVLVFISGFELESKAQIFEWFRF